jgi:hypothetical protein
MEKDELCWEVHKLVNGLKSFQGSSEELPLNGIYFFFEDGESCEKDGAKLERIVRVGTHREQGNFRRRIWYHYNGNKNGSVFRKHLGGALIARDDPSDKRLSQWLAQDTPTYPEIEELVSRILRNRFHFRYVIVDDPDERLQLEECLIATLAGCQSCKPSSNWLGRYAKDEKIRLSGLWNSQHVDSMLPSRDSDWFSRFCQLLDASRSGAMSAAGPFSHGSADKWEFVNQQVRKCVGLPTPEERSNCLRRLYDETQDGMAAFALGQELERQQQREEALRFYRIAEERFPLAQYKGMASEAVKRLESSATHEVKPEVLVIVCCTKTKIWDEDPTAPRYVPAQFAYRGCGFKKWIQEDLPLARRKLGDLRWVILSAKYGFIEPWHPIGKYDVSFSNPTSGPISRESLKQQAIFQTRIWKDSQEVALSGFKRVVYYENCANDYVERIKYAFGDDKVRPWREFLSERFGSKS